VKSSSNPADLPCGVNQVLSLLDQNQTVYQLRSFEQPAHHAGEAADLLDCPLGAVVKSLVFQKNTNSEILLILVSGENRVDLDRLRELVGESVHPARPADVLKKTGYPVGAIPPFGMAGEFPVFIDEDLMYHDIVWSSAGVVNILLGIAPEVLERLSGGTIVRR
jgi:Cys-tRNA(Pro) deacylase